MNEEDRELKASFNAIKAMIKQDLVHEMITSSGLSIIRDFGDVDHADVERLKGIYKKVANAKAMFKLVDESISTAKEESSGGSRW